MEKGQTFFFSEIEAFAAEKELEIQEYGKELIGANFLSLGSDYHDNVVGFVLVGSRSCEYVYECIYTDL